MDTKKTNTADIEDVFAVTGKYNTRVKVTDEDAKAGIKIYCQEPYAQELYDKMKAYELETGNSIHACKDLTVGNIYDVTANQISFDEKYIRATEVNSAVEVMIPFNEYASSIDELTKDGVETTFNIMIIKTDRSGSYIGSQKKCVSINYAKELQAHFANKTWFEVKIKKLNKLFI